MRSIICFFWSVSKPMTKSSTRMSCIYIIVTRWGRAKLKRPPELWGKAMSGVLRVLPARKRGPAPKFEAGAARMAQLRHRFPAYLFYINFKGVSGKVGGDGFPLSPSSSDVPQNLLPDVHTLCRLALKPPDAPLALQVERRPVSLHERRYRVALTTMRSACVLSTTFTTLTPYGSAASLARGARARGAPGA